MTLSAWFPRNCVQILFFIVLTHCFAFATFAEDAGPKPREGFDWSAARTFAIQDRGRFKPLQTFAMESVQHITGKRSWKGLGPVEVLFGWLVVFESEWLEEPFILVNYKPLKAQLGLSEEKKYFTPAELRQSEPLQALLREAIPKQRNKEKLTPLEKKAVELQTRRLLLEQIVVGQAWSILPSPDGMDAKWLTLGSLTDRSAASVYTPAQMEALAASVGKCLDAYQGRDAKAWGEATASLQGLFANDLSLGKYPTQASLNREVHYNELRPFRWSWVLYVFAFIGLTAAIVTKATWAKYFGGALLGAGFLLHTYGFLVRMLVSGRPPVTNMYESVIWVSWGCILFALVIWGLYKSEVIPAAAAVFSVVSLVLADNLPNMLDPTIQPLEPVLRSNFWLTIHVLTITLSYAAFALSLCLGNVVLGSYLFAPGATKQIQVNTLYMYRAIQIGVVLLAAGTILGGVWADYSWGRFWGWDPKEVWALIALLLYVAVLHGRFAGWLKGFGFAASAVVSFLGVLMAWYGVNFVLGAGLHSYGFGSGGLPWVAGYVLAQVAFILAAYYRYRKEGEKGAGIFPRGSGR